MRLGDTAKVLDILTQAWQVQEHPGGAKRYRFATHRRPIVSRLAEVSGARHLIGLQTSSLCPALTLRLLILCSQRQ